MRSTGTLTSLSAGHPVANSAANRLQDDDRAVHEWYRFVLSFPPHLVRHYLDLFGSKPGQLVLDPFCGTGTTVAECKKLGLRGIGVEATPMAHFASSVKCDWGVDPDALEAHADEIAEIARRNLARDGTADSVTDVTAGAPPRLRSLQPDQARLLLKDSISPRPLHKSLTLLDCIDNHPQRQFRRHERVAFARTTVQNVSNLRFGPEVGVGRPKRDAEVIGPWRAAISRMSADLRQVQRIGTARTDVLRADARDLSRELPGTQIDAVITSPPYPNEKDYTRTARLESVLLGFIADRADLRAFKRTLLRSNTRTAYRDDQDDRWVNGHPEIERIAAEIEARRIDLGKTSGFERPYRRVVKLYFGGMVRHLANLRSILTPGAKLAYVVGDQASYLRVMIRTGQILADLAERMGYEVFGLDLFRTRRATATRAELREEVLLLKWPGR